jgi:hypothetical protein
MSWNWIPPGQEPQSGKARAVDRIAQTLAMAAGEDWERIPNHPGVGRAKWREMALKMMIEMKRRH